MDNKPTIRIVTDGTRYGTMIYGTDGQPLEYVTAFQITATDWHKGPQLTLELDRPALDMHFPVENVQIVQARKGHIAHLQGRIAALETGLRELQDTLLHDSKCLHVVYEGHCNCRYIKQIALITRLLEGTPDAQ